MNFPNTPIMPPIFGQVPQMAPAGEIVWVQSQEQLNALNLPPVTTRIYMNSGEPEFYIVTTDKIGMKSVTAYTFIEKPKPVPVEYVTKNEFAELVKLLKEAKYESHSTEYTASSAGRPADNKTKHESAVTPGFNC